MEDPLVRATRRFTTTTAKVGVSIRFSRALLSRVHASWLPIQPKQILALFFIASKKREERNAPSLYGTKELLRRSSFTSWGKASWD